MIFLVIWIFAMFFFTICFLPLKHFWHFIELVNDKVESVDISQNSYSNHPKSLLLKTWVIYFLRSNFSVMCFCEPLKRVVWCISCYRWLLKQLSRLITKVDCRVFFCELVGSKPQMKKAAPLNSFTFSWL